MPLDSVGNTQSLLGGEKRCASRSRITAAKQIVAPVLFNSVRDFLAAVQVCGLVNLLGSLVSTC